MLEKVCKMWQALIPKFWRDHRRVDIPSTITRILYIDSITDIHVCGYLSRAGPFLHRVEFFIPSDGVGMHVLHSINQYCINLKYLRLITDMHDFNVRHVLTCYSTYIKRQINRLETFHFHYTGTDKLALGLELVNMQLFNVTNYRLEVPRMPDHIECLFPINDKVKTYSLISRQGVKRVSSELRALSPTWIYNVWEYLTQAMFELEEMELICVHSDKVNEKKMSKLVKLFSESHPRMKRLGMGITSVHLDEPNSWFGKTALKAIKSFDNLEHLALQGVELPSDFTNYLPVTIKGITLNCIRNLSTNLLDNLITKCPGLEAVELRNSTDLVVDVTGTAFALNVIRSCRNLKKLKFYDFEHIDRLSIAKYAFKKLHNCAPSTNPLASVGVKIEIGGFPWNEEFQEQMRKALICCSKIEYPNDDLVQFSIHRTCRQFLKTEEVDERPGPTRWALQATPSSE
ncbi:hypothetical protein L596_004373 [Steinernema carpocapsae]|uniref:F-box domain-containing protein n=1 Tax=Steinernema carpocapsae TaxID=34508 RepID=A0A4U8UVJ1_STECR|nr:hypothetical protein L596_004373 [Steinernema carpocapsae]